jgi:ribosomal protein S18 acetylase RimI-like enzyme
LATRIARPVDASALHELAASTFALACPAGTSQAEIDNHIATELSVARFEQYLADPAREIRIAGDFLGYTMLVLGEPTDPDVLAAITIRPTIELSKCYLRQESHGTGLAAELMDATIASAREHGASALWLGVSQLNGRANRFYEKNGFERVGIKYFHVGEEVHNDFVRQLDLR